MTKIKRDVFYLDFESEYKESKYQLVRSEDGKTINGNRVKWVEWGEDRRAKDFKDKIELDHSCVIDANGLGSYSWLTTVVTEILEQREDYIKFKTKNSTYILFIR